MARDARRHRFAPSVESLETRAEPAIIASQVALTLPVLDVNEVRSLLLRASVATASNDAIIAVVDRNGTILGALVENGVSPTITQNSDRLIFAVDGAVSKARTAAFFANDTAPLTSRTVQFISQSTITEREVESDPSLRDPNSPFRGPGFVAPIGTGGHFPPNVAYAPQVDLFGIEHTNRDSFLHPGNDHVKGTADDIPLANRFNVPAAFIPAGKNLAPPLSYGEAILTPAGQRDPAVNHYQSRGIATLPGGVPLYQYGTLIGGIGVFFPGATGFANEENSSLGVDFNAALPDRTLEAEFMAVAAAGGSKAAGLPVGTIGGIPLPPGFNLPAPRIDLVGITLDVIGPGGIRGPLNLVQHANSRLGVGLGAPGTNFLPVNAAGNFFVQGRPVPAGYLVAPHAGVGITAAEVRRIIEQGVAEANRTRAQIRTPANETTRMVFAVADRTGQVLGLYRMPDATAFSIDVAVAKARNTAYYNDPAQLQPEDRVPGVPPGASFTNRTFRYLAVPRYPISVENGPPGPFSSLNDPNIDRLTGLQTGPRLPPSAYRSILLYDAFNVGTNFHAPTNPANQNGIVFFPGSGSVYRGSQVIGGFGVSGDGVDQDDVVTSGGLRGFDAPPALRADQFFVLGVRLPFRKFPRTPQRL